MSLLTVHGAVWILNNAHSDLPDHPPYLQRGIAWALSPARVRTLPNALRNGPAVSLQYPSSVKSLGCAVIPGVFSCDQIAQLVPLADEAVRSSSARAGARIGVGAELVVRVLAHEPYADVIGSLGAYQPVRVIVFEKSADQNWAVAWHRDVAIAVQARHALEGFGPWSMKDGVHHVQPPPSVLRDMVTARLHLDPAPTSNGALQVIPGSHMDIGEDWPSVDSGRGDREPITLEAGAGDVVLMNPLTLHASSKSTQLGHRRVVHIEFARVQLPEPLLWHD